MTMNRNLTSMALATLAVALAFPATALASSLDGSVLVDNGRHLPLNVRIDGSTPRFVAAGERAVFRAVPNGVRLVEFASPGIAPQVERVQVDAGREALVRVAALTGSARFRNLGSVPLRLAIDGQPVGRLAPGETLGSGPLLAGTHVVAARPAGSHGHHGAVMGAIQDSFEVVAGRETHVPVGPRSASLEVHNPFPRPVTVLVDGARVGQLRGGESVRLEDQAPGRHSVVLMSHGRALAESSVTLRPGAFERWRPVVALTGALRVVNTTHRTLKVRLDGTRLGKLRPGETRVLRDLAAGTHEVELRGGGLTVRRSVDVRPHAEAVVTSGGQPAVVVSQAEPRPRRRR
jgi:hypothetical protein